VHLDNGVAGPRILDYSRSDLNGDGAVGGPVTFRFDLDRFGSTQFGQTKYDLVTQQIQGKSVDFDETRLTDQEILCYYAYSELYTGDPKERDALLKDVCTCSALQQANSARRALLADQCEEPSETKLTASDAAVNRFFGSSVGISGDTIVAGNSGIGAYVFVRNGTSWIEQQKLIKADGFGVSAPCAINGDTIVAGNGISSTSVFVLNGSDWIEQQKLTPSDSLNLFNRSVGISGDTIVVGRMDAGAFVQVGAAYVYVRNGSNWTQQQKLNASGGATNDFAGAFVAISGDTIVVGTPFERNAFGNFSGAAYVYVRNGTSWTRQQKLTDLFGSQFGGSVGISGDTLVVGDPGSGAVSVYVRTNGTSWVRQQKLTFPGGNFYDFGGAVGVSGDTVVVGAPFEDNAEGFSAGAGYVYVRNGTSWTQQQRLASDGATQFDNVFFGQSVGISDDTLVVGAPFEDNAGGTNAGAAYVFPTGN
jgi:hypothetical protein